MAVLGSNIAAIRAQRRLSEATSGVSRASERLASGLRINRSSDDAAGLAISSLLNTDSRVFGQAVRNANDALSALSIHDGTLEQMSTVAFRLGELATQASNGALSRTQRIALDKEAAQLVNEYNRMVGTTKFNGLSLLSGTLGTLGVQLGYGANGKINMNLAEELSRNVSNTFNYNAAGFGFIVSSGGTYASVAGDMNGDGYADVVRSDGGSQIYVFGSDSDGVQYDSIIQNASTAVARANNLAVGDMNGDGMLDIVATGDGFSEVLLQQSNGTYVSAGTSVMGEGERNQEVQLLDVNNDGKLDVLGSDGAGQLQVALGNGSGGFTSTVTSASLAGIATNALQTGDFDGDGNVDVVTTNTDGSLRLFRGQGTGSFSAASVIGSVGNTTTLSTGDINFDGMSDILVVTSANALNVMTATGGGNFTTASAGNGGLTARDSRLVDYDADGILDIASLSVAGLTLSKGNGDGTFSGGTSIAGVSFTDIEFGDFNGDGASDFLFVDEGSGGGDGFEVGYGNASVTTTIARVNLTTQSSARSAMGSVRNVLSMLGRERGAVGAIQSRIQSALQVLYGEREGFQSASSQIQDADVALEAAALMKSQIIQQSASAILGQANQEPALALQLLNGAARNTPNR